MEEKKAGWNVDINKPDSLIKLLQQLMLMDNNEYQLFCDGAYRLANDYYTKSDFKNAYSELFDMPDVKR